MARIETHGLRRSVGVGGLFATAYGNVGSSIYYALGLVAAYALGLTPVVFMLAGGLFALTAKTYAEGASMFPEAGGSSSFARHAFNELVSFFAGWALSLDYILTIAISAFFVPHYLGAFWPALTHPPGDVIGGLIVIVLLAWLNIRGIGESANLNLILAVLDLATQCLIIIIGAFLVLNPTLLVNQVHLGTVPTYSHVIFALSLAMLAYTGIETVSNMAEEARNPGRDVPRAVNMILIAVLGVYAGMTVVALSALPVIGHGAHATTQLGQPPPHGYQNDPVLGIIEHLGLATTATHVLRYYVGILAATILFIATNAGLIGISRLSWSLAEHRQLPGVFARLHRKHRTPWFTIVVFSTFAGILLIPGQTDFLGNLYSFGAMLSFTTAHASVIALRIKDPDRERPYKMPGNIKDPRRRDPGDGGGRRDRHVRRLGVGAGPARRRALRRHRLDDRRPDGLRDLPPPVGLRSDLAPQDRPPRAAGVLRRARLPLGGGADLRHRRRRLGAARCGKARGGGRDRRGDLRAARPQPAFDRRRTGSRGAARDERARERQDDRPQSRAQGADEIDPDAQSRRGDRRGGAALGGRDHLPRHRSRAPVRALARPDGELPAGAPPVPGRDRDFAAGARRRAGVGPGRRRRSAGARLCCAGAGTAVRAASSRKPVTDAGVGADVAGSVARLDLAAQVRDVGAEHLCVVAVAWAPN